MHIETERAYLAGLVDGEGHLGITVAKLRSNGVWRTHVVIVTVSNTFLPLMTGLRESWGGTLVVRKASTQSDALIGNLRWSSWSAGQVLREIRPYMRIKHAQADLCIAFANELAARNGPTQRISRAEWERREELRVAIRRLNAPRTPIEPLPYPENPPLTCVQCGQAFVDYQSPRARYCSKVCIGKARWQRVKAKP